jgi:hypothetical protein
LEIVHFFPVFVDIFRLRAVFQFEGTSFRAISGWHFSTAPCGGFAAILSRMRFLMRSRAALVILGCVLMGLSLAGILLVQAEQERQQQAFKTKVAMEAAKVEAERKRAEDLGQQIEIERRKVDDAQASLTAERERRKEEELLRRKSEQNRLAATRQETQESPPQVKPEEYPKVGKDSSGRSGESALSQSRKGSQARTSNQTDRAAQKGSKAGRTVTIRFKYDPSASKEIQVARVHLGDRVKVRVKRMAGADRKLYVGLTSPGWRGRRIPGGNTLVATPIRDSDEFKVIPPYGIMRGLTGALDTEAGAILNIGTDNNRTPPVRGPSYGPRRGYYEVEISIYSENRWDIKPRSLL